MRTQDNQVGTVTMRDIARAAGVSTSTVSRALRTPEAISRGPQLRIQDIAHRMGYAGVRPGKERHTSRRYALGVVVPDLENPLFAALVKSAQARARWWGFSLTIIDSDEDSEVEADGIKTLKEKCDGTLWFSPRSNDKRIEQHAGGHPTVLVNRELPGIGSITLDEAASMLQVVRHLSALGHSRIAYVSGPRTSWSDRARHDALLDAITDGEEGSGIELEEIGHTAPSFQGGVSAADWVLASGVSAVLCHNDLIALGLLSRCVERGVSLPEELSIVGHDGIHASSYVTPAITTITIPSHDMGRDAVDLLVARLEGQPPTHLRVSAHLTVRESTDVPHAKS